jgi:hypothetical protein
MCEMCRKELGAGEEIIAVVTDGDCGRKEGRVRDLRLRPRLRGAIGRMLARWTMEKSRPV